MATLGAAVLLAARAYRDGLAEGVVQVAVDEAGLAHARLACRTQHGGGRWVLGGCGIAGHLGGGATRSSLALPGPHRRHRSRPRRLVGGRGVLLGAQRTEKHQLEVNRLHDC